MNAMEISRTALDVEWKRLEVIAQNIANANTVLGQTGEPFRPLRLLSGPAANFAEMLSGPKQSASLTGVRVYSIEPQDVPARRVFEPAHPQADKDGFVSYPGFDHATEMALMVKTARVYEANVVALTTARQLFAKALEIGRRGA